MKNIFYTLLLFLCFNLKAQNVLHAGELDWADNVEQIPYQAKVSTAGCGTPFLSTGYPLWTNYWAGWMINIINTNACPIVINSFEARFDGTSGYRIYTKTGTFVGFETTPGPWTLVGTVASLTGTSTIAPTAIPIAVNVVIAAGATQAFYLTRTDNLVANRHLYNTGSGTAGTTVYAADGNLSITEGSYVDPFFAFLNIGVRRPSFDVCYTINCALPIELLSFNGESLDGYNKITWKTATEKNNSYFKLESSVDAQSWKEVNRINGSGNSLTEKKYSVNDYSFSSTINYYKLTQVDSDGQSKSFNIIAVDNSRVSNTKLIKIVNVFGQQVSNDYNGIKIYCYDDGTYVKKIETNHQ